MLKKAGSDRIFRGPKPKAPIPKPNMPPATRIPVVQEANADPEHYRPGFGPQGQEAVKPVSHTARGMGIFFIVFIIFAFFAYMYGLSQNPAYHGWNIFPSPYGSSNIPNLYGNSTNKYDGSYGWSLISVHGESRQCSNCVSITDGKISNSEGSFTSAVFDTNGDISFYGPCPNGNSATGLFSGSLIRESPPSWEGTWTCDDGSDGGSASMWKIS